MRASVERAIAGYLGEFEALLRAFCGRVVHPLRFRDLVEPTTPLEACERQADRNLALLHGYWAESEGRSDAEAATLPSHRALVDAGWAGHIPPEMRAHYLGGSPRSILTPRTRDEWTGSCDTSRWCSSTSSCASSRTRGGPWLKASMYKPAPGIPESRIVGRLHLRTLPRSVTTKVMPPWTAKGCLGMDADGALRPALESFRLAAARGARFVPGRLTVHGGGRAVGIRSDVALPATVPGGSRWRSGSRSDHRRCGSRRAAAGGGGRRALPRRAQPWLIGLRWVVCTMALLLVYGESLRTHMATASDPLTFADDARQQMPAFARCAWIRAFSQLFPTAR